MGKDDYNAARSVSYVCNVRQNMALLTELFFELFNIMWSHWVNISSAPLRCKLKLLTKSSEHDVTQVAESCCLMVFMRLAEIGH